ncbi:MAG: PEP/pyruvate-binding domain-containing protein [Desulfobacteraceae bacterium]
MESNALEVNLFDTKVNVSIEEKYRVLQDIVSDYHGILKRMNAFLEELSHPYINWEFIVKETRHFSLHYFYLYKDHEEGNRAFELFIDIFLRALDQNLKATTLFHAAGNLMLLLQHVLKEPCQNREEFIKTVARAADQIQRLNEDLFSSFVRCWHQPDKLAQLLLNADEERAGDFTAVNLFLKRYYEFSFSCFLKEKDPFFWITDDPDIKNLPPEAETILQTVSHEQIQQFQEELEQLTARGDTSSRLLTEKLLTLPGYMDLVSRFKNIPGKLSASMGDKNPGKRLKLVFLFYTLHLPGLETIHEQTLREINRTLTFLIDHGNFKNNLRMIDNTFELLKNNTGTYPETVLDCIHRIGEAVYKTGEVELINYFVDHVIDTGFQFPAIKGTGEDWQIKGNNAHVKNIRVFLDLIGKNPLMSSRLFSALIISMAMGGVFIKDTDLFPREMTKFLNSDIAPVFNLVKQMARLLPIFFNKIGAEGELRDISTRLDESCKRGDVLVHFLRKQSHVESSSRVVEFMEQVFVFWKTGNKKKLQPYLPPSLFKRIDPSGVYVNGLRNILKELSHKGFTRPREYLQIKEKDFPHLIDTIDNASTLDKTRIKLAIHFYQLLNEKYRFDNIEFEKYILTTGEKFVPEPEKLTAVLSGSDTKEKIAALLEYAELLKETILSPGTFKPEEYIYHKRHFAIDIPSMYGSYHEEKFDALGLTLRIENIINVLFEELVNSADFHLMTKAAFGEIHEILKLFSRALKLDGITSNKMELQLEFLWYSIKVKACSFTQYMDIFRGFSSAVRDIISDHFNTIHRANFMQIGSNIRRDQVLKKFLCHNNFDQKNRSLQRAAEIFFRDRIVTSLGLQQLDLFLNRILHTLFRQSEELSQNHLDKLLNYDPKNTVFRIDGRLAMESNIIYLGNKGINLIKMKNMGLPVPNGFIVSTEVFRCLAIIDKYTPANQNYKQHVALLLAHLEKISKKTFGNPENPLLLSVRSGSSISQPGMMDSFLNVGMNREITEKIAETTKNPWFAWDSYRRFLQGYGMAFDINRNEFDRIMNSFKEKFSKKMKREFTGSQMKATAMGYKQFILDQGIEIAESPVEQLYLAISKVFESWDSLRAKNYRKIIGISNDWGTAVTIQEMIFGNRSLQSGSGVVFSHSPKLPGDTIRLWGDYTIGNQGEDVVSGLVKTLPISEMQREIEKRESDISLEKGFPHIYAGLKKIIHKLIYDNGWNPQEIEFTFEGPEEEDLYLLQARDMSLRDQKVIRSFDMEQEQLDARLLSRGTGVSGGALSGRAVFTIEEIEKFREKEPEMPLIILREDTVPDDILEIDAADGILTARGGVTSHAAIVAYSLGKTCVVGCENFDCNEKEKTCMLNGFRITSGEFLSVSGREGSVYRGLIKVKNL